MIKHVTARILARIRIVDGCWEYKGHISNNGYGKVREGGRGSRVVYTHRAMYSHFIGPIPPGCDVHHLCSNTRCCNPEHMRALPAGVNRGKVSPWLVKEIRRMDISLSWIGDCHNKYGNKEGSL